MASEALLITAALDNRLNEHRVTLATGSTSHLLSVAPRESGYGSKANGGELLCLALATCYCNDIYREAAKRSIEVVSVEVRAEAEFGGQGQPARRISYSVVVRARAGEAAVRDLIVHTDKVAEVQNTLRLGMPVLLHSYQAVEVARDDAA